jgi:glucosamine-phosphate N-acetyltransferase
MEFRNLEYGDYNKNYFDLLSQLTICGNCTQNQFEKFVDNLNKNHIVIVYEENNKILASGTLFIEPKLIRNCGLVGHIEDIVVDKELNGKGIGKKLVCALSDYAKDNGCYKVILDCRSEIISFYEKCGFSKKEEQMVQYFIAANKLKGK